MSLRRMIYSLFLTVLNLQPRGQMASQFGSCVWQHPGLLTPLATFITCLTIPQSFQHNGNLAVLLQSTKSTNLSILVTLDQFQSLQYYQESLRGIIIVRRDMYQVLAHPDFSHLFNDQLAFRPTGSTTAGRPLSSPHSQSQKPQICPPDSFRLF